MLRGFHLLGGAPAASRSGTTVRGATPPETCWRPCEIARAGRRRLGECSVQGLRRPQPGAFPHVPVQRSSASAESHVGMWTPLVTCPIGISSSGQRGKRGRKRRRLTFPCRRLTPFAAPLRDCQIRHVERLRGVVRVLAAQRQQVMERNAQLLFGIPAQVLLDEGRSETVETGGHRRVGGEEIAARVAASATSKGWPVSSMKVRARSNTANAACPSFR